VNWVPVGHEHFWQSLLHLKSTLYSARSRLTFHTWRARSRVFVHADYVQYLLSTLTCRLSCYTGELNVTMMTRTRMVISSQSLEYCQMDPIRASLLSRVLNLRVLI
jgi:hypothetical protein